MRHRFGRPLATACLLLSLGTRAANAQAPSPPVANGEAREVAAAMAKEMGTEAMMRQMLDRMRDQLVNAIASRNPGANATKAVDEIIMPEFRNGIGTILDKVVDIYATHFDLEELRGLRAFYETPVGRKSIRMLPEIMRESQIAGESWGRTTLQDIITKRGDDLRGMGIDLSK